MSEIVEQFDSNVLSLTFNRPSARNAITPEMYAALNAALTRAQQDPEVRVVLIRGNEQAFTAGSDIANLKSGVPALEDSSVVQFSFKIAELSKPIVAAVCGHAVGIGATMLLHCDLVIAGTNARFRFPFVDLGICPEAASSLILPRMLGHQRASELLLIGDSFDAHKALDYGLVNYVERPDEVDRRALELTKRLATKPLSSLVETKRLMKEFSEGQVRGRIIEETHLIARMQNEPAAREAFAKFLAK